MKRLFLCLALLAWSGLASAVVYKWVDAQGKLQYGDRPPDGVHAEVVAMYITHASRSAPPPRPASASGSSQPIKPASDAKAAADVTTKKAVDEDVAQTREKQCAAAQDRYKKLVEGRRIYKTSAQGERQYMSTEEIDAARVDAKRDLDEVCNSAS